MASVGNSAGAGTATGLGAAITTAAGASAAASSAAGIRPWYNKATALTLTNAGFEGTGSGSTAGWTVGTGALVLGPPNDDWPRADSGDYYVYGGNNSALEAYTTVAVPAALESAIDAGDVVAYLTWAQLHYQDTDDPGAMGIAFYDVTPSLISRTDATEINSGGDAWAARAHALAVPANTRSIRVYMTATRTSVDITLNAYFDSIAVSLLEGVEYAGHAAAPEIVGDVKVTGSRQVIGLTEAAAIFGDVDVTGNVESTALLSTPVIFGDALCVGVEDFTGNVVDAAERYVMDVTGGPSDLRIPISSWQATIQTTFKSYLQAVIPAAGDYVDELSSRQAAGGEFVIRRVATLDDGSVLEYEMARAPLDQVRYDRGALRYTCTLIAYTDPVTAVANPGAYARTLSGVRLISQNVETRVRSSIDWLLRPGHHAIADGNTFTVAYISYYVNATESYMDVGTRTTP